MRKEGVKDTLKGDFNIFLSGKMTGLSIDEMSGWREEFAEKIDADWFGFSNTPHVINPCEIFGMYDVEPLWKEHKEYVRTELRWAKNCDLLVLAVSENQDSIGSACELATAYAAGKPIILYNPHKIQYEMIHPFVWEMSDACFEDMEELTEYIREVYLL